MKARPWFFWAIAAGTLGLSTAGNAATYVDHRVKVSPPTLPEPRTENASKAGNASEEAIAPKQETVVGEALEAPLPTNGHPLSDTVRHLGTEDPAYVVMVSLERKGVEVFLRTESGTLARQARYPLLGLSRQASRDAFEKAFYPVSFDARAVRAWEVSRPEAGRRPRLRPAEILFGEASPRRKGRARAPRASFTLSPENYAALSAVLVPLRTPVVVLPAESRRGKTAAASSVVPVETVLARVGGWRDAWERSQADAYADAYAEASAEGTREGFRSLGRSRDTWLARIARLNALEGGTRRVSVSQPHVLRVNGRTLAVFAQEYASNARNDYGLKVLAFDDDTRAPRIVAENWMPVNGSFATRLAKREPVKSPKAFRD